MARMIGVRSARFTDSQNKLCRKANVSTGGEPLLDAPRIVEQQLPGQPRGTREPLVPRTIRGSVQCTLEELTYRTEREVTLELIAINSSPLKLNTLSPAAPGFGARGPQERGLSDPLRSRDQDRPTTASLVQPLTEHG
ncbi:MAG TPA: hypothetical protein VIX82_19485 [Solirubrobacteraceae bacterium]